jgi:hypothetical protein
VRRLVILACLVAVVIARPLAAATSARAPVVVTLVIDQLAAWIASERLPLLPSDGGFARLKREGTSARTLVFEHAVTDTAPGHAALYTGAPARVSGIFANEVIDDVERERVSILRDPTTHIIASDGPRQFPSSSLRQLLVPTLADTLRAARPKANIVSLSLKDRAALFGGGRTPTACVWFDASVGRFVTSSALSEDFPAWAKPLVPPDFLRQQLAHTWSLDGRELDFVRAHAATSDDAPGEGEIPGEKVTFPHALADAADPGSAFRATPFADDTLLALGLAAVDARDATQPMLLAISLSGNDYIGHVYGPDSWEAWDELMRLDAALGRFFAALDDKLGAEGWAVLLSADHGVTTMPEPAPFLAVRPWCKPGAPRDRFQRNCGPTGRLLPEDLGDQLRAVAERTLGKGDWIAGIADPYVYLTPQGRALEGDKRRALDEALTFALRSTPGVADVLDARHPPAHCLANDTPASLVCRALPPSLPGELYVLTQPGWFFDPNYVVGKGTSHGTPYFYDRSVPLLARAPGRIARGRVIEKSVTPGAFARTAAALLGVPAPPAAARAMDLATP